MTYLSGCHVLLCYSGITMSKYVLPVKIDRGTGNPVLLLHGLGNNHSSWEFVLEHLDYSRQRVIAVDLLGFGDALKPDIQYKLEDHSSAIAATLKSLGLENIVVVGHSMGCNIALDLATRYPELVRKLVLFGAPLYRNAPRGGKLRSLLRSEGLYFSMFELVQRSPEVIQAGGQLAEEYVPFVRGMEITEETWPAYRKSLENTIMQFDSYRQACSLEIPAVFVNGIFDFFIIRGNTNRVQLKNRKHVRIKHTRGPHELTPAQGRVAARIISKAVREV